MFAWVVMSLRPALPEGLCPGDSRDGAGPGACPRIWGCQARRCLERPGLRSFFRGGTVRLIPWFGRVGVGGCTWAEE